MLKHLQDLGFRAGLFAAAPLPEPEIARVLAVLDEFYGPGRQVAALVPLADEAPLRAASRQRRPVWRSWARPCGSGWIPPTRGC